MLKPIAISCLSVAALIGTAFAAPILRIETSISGRNAEGEMEVLSKPTVIVESGKPATIRMGKISYEVTPILRENGTVDIQTSISKDTGKRSIALANPRVIVEMGKEGKIESKNYTLTLQPSLEK